MSISNPYFINPCYKTEKVIRFVEDLIQSYSCEYFEDIPFSQKCEFAALLIEASGKNSHHEFLVESNNLDQVMREFMKSLAGIREDDLSFIESMKETAVNYFEPTMRNIFNRATEEFDRYSEVSGW